MGQRQSASILVDEYKSRTAYSCRRCAQAGSDATDQRSFPRPQLTEKRERFPSLQ